MRKAVFLIALGLMSCGPGSSGSPVALNALGTSDNSVSFSMTAQMAPGDVATNGSASVSATSVVSIPNSVMVSQGTAEPDGMVMLWLQGTVGSGNYCEYRLSSPGTYTLQLAQSVGCSTSLTVASGTTLIFQFQTGYFTYPETPPLSVILSITISGTKS